MDIHQILGVLSACILLYAGYPYIRDILYGDARPNRVTWFGWILLSGSSALIQLTHHPDNSVFFVAADATLNAVIFILAFYKGVTAFRRLDGICLFFGLLGMVLWLGLDQPVLALLSNIFADLCFGIPSIVKTYANPSSESLDSWRLQAIGTFIGLLSKTDIHLTNTLFPTFLFLTCFTFYLLAANIPQRIVATFRRQ